MFKVELHPYLPQNDLLEFCKQHKILVTAYSPLGSGRDPKLMDDPVVKEIAQECGKPEGSILINWAVHRDTVVIPKSVTPSRIVQNLEVVDLSADQMKRLNTISKHHRYINPAKFWNVDLFGGSPSKV